MSHSDFDIVDKSADSEPLRAVQSLKVPSHWKLMSARYLAYAIIHDLSSSDRERYLAEIIIKMSRYKKFR